VSKTFRRQPLPPCRWTRPGSAKQAEGPPSGEEGGGWANDSPCVCSPFDRQKGGKSSQTGQGANFKGGQVQANGRGANDMGGAGRRQTPPPLNPRPSHHPQIRKGYKWGDCCVPALCCVPKNLGQDRNASIMKWHPDGFWNL